VPDKIDRLTDVFGDDVVSVVVAVRAGKNYYSEFHKTVVGRQKLEVGGKANVVFRFPSSVIY
jgi:hypothetical protein